LWEQNSQDLRKKQPRPQDKTAKASGKNSQGLRIKQPRPQDKTAKASG